MSSRFRSFAGFLGGLAVIFALVEAITHASDSNSWVVGIAAWVIIGIVYLEGTLGSRHSRTGARIDKDVATAYAAGQDVTVKLVVTNWRGSKLFMNLYSKFKQPFFLTEIYSAEPPSVSIVKS